MLEQDLCWSPVTETFAWGIVQVRDDVLKGSFGGLRNIRIGGKKIVAGGRSYSPQCPFAMGQRDGKSRCRSRD